MRSRLVACGGLRWVVYSTGMPCADVETQVLDTLHRLDEALRGAGSDWRRLPSVPVILAEIGTRDAFDTLRQAWIGPDAQHWPQRAMYGGPQAPGLLPEVNATAARGVGEGS